MNRLFFAALLASIVIAGCGAPAESTTSATPPTTTASTTEKAKCEACGGDFAKAELVSHDGKMACPACIKAHNH